MITKRWMVFALTAVVLFVVNAPAYASEFARQDVYRVPAETTIEDDLYVMANEVYIEGNVHGDLLVLGGYVEINGRVEEDVMIAAGAVTLTGEIEGDARLFAGGVTITGTIDDDLVTSVWGDAALTLPLQIDGDAVEAGFLLAPEATVKGTATINGGGVGGGNLQGGSASVAGTVGKDLTAFINELDVTGRVDGDADLTAVALSLDNADIEGALTYSTPQPVTNAEAASETVSFIPLVSEEDTMQLWSQLALQIVSVLTGLSLLGWLLLRLSPQSLARPVAVMMVQPVKCAWLGLGTVILYPLAVVLVLLSVTVFWGLGAAVVVGAAAFSLLFLVGIFSPLLTGLWIGLRFTNQPLTALIIGSLILVPLIHLRQIGGLFWSFSFIFALGGLVLSRHAEQFYAPEQNE